jgi:hypothetical protein
LDALYPNNPDGRQSLLNELDSATRRLIASARSRDALRALAERLPAAAREDGLRRAAADFDPTIRALVARLAGLLEPLAGGLDAGAGQELTGSEAIELYRLVHQTVFLRSSADTLSLEEALGRIQELLD